MDSAEDKKPSAARPGEISVELEMEGGEEAEGSGVNSLPPIARFGRYDLLGRVAVGGMAEIYLARELSEAAQASRNLALKFVRPQFSDDEELLELFLNEARVAMKLNHPNICQVIEFGKLTGRYFLAMEWIHGVSLMHLVGRAGRVHKGLEVPIAVKVVAQVAEALDSAHRAKDEFGKPLHLVHRDVSPHNVMVSYEGVVKLLDFGVAKVKQRAAMSAPKKLKGKFAYMSPEQVSGAAVDARSDIFALGICLYEALSGRRLFRRGSQVETLRAVIQEPPPPLRKFNSGVSERLEKIVLKALEKKPSDRYQTAGELQLALEQLLADEREVVNATRIRHYMHGLYAEEIGDGPKLDTRPDVTGSFLTERPSDDEVAGPWWKQRWAWGVGAGAAAALVLLGLVVTGEPSAGEADGASAAAPATAQPAADPPTAGAAAPAPAAEPAEPAAVAEPTETARPAAEAAPPAAPAEPAEETGEAEAQAPARARAARTSPAEAPTEATGAEEDEGATAAAGESWLAATDESGSGAAEKGESGAAEDESTSAPERTERRRRRRGTRTTRGGFVADPGF